ncbi:hypothetical protein BKA70DRAFT_1433226 [Coprinopsis sp. MPI-PUGE-AT-0042]|nr:hypothetical protein BKA70DRAFT_1435675 [Coprinopsis sp. MPI-PUGE-AT-0042]KAH6903603.1 hypothetical protein BKA70DRAFT_1433226 [Coprinopsis sp. MPI-PUGE-AT-0042]
MRTPSLPSTIRLVDHTAWPHEWLERLEDNPNLGSTVAVTHGKDKFGVAIMADPCNSSTIETLLEEILRYVGRESHDLHGMSLF